MLVALAIVIVLIAPPVAPAMNKLYFRELTTDDPITGNGGGGGGYSSSYGTRTYTEYHDAFKRFSEFRVVDPDGDGTVDLPGLPYIPQTEARAALVPLTGNEQIRAYAVSLGITTDSIVAQINAALGWDSTFDTLRNDAINEVLHDRYREAAAILAPTPAGITYWCGPEGDPQPFNWSFAIPVTLNCDSDSTDELLVVTPLTAMEASANTISKTAHIRTAQGLTTVKKSGLETANERYAIGVGYMKHHFGTVTSSQKTWSLGWRVAGIDIKINPANGQTTGMDPPVATTRGSADWTNTELMNPFAVGDRVYFSYGSKFTQARSVNMYLNRTATAFNISFVNQDPVKGNFNLTVTSPNLGIITDYNVSLPLLDDHFLRLNVVNLSQGMRVGYVKFQAGEAGTKRDVLLSDHAGASTETLEVKGTYYVQSAEELVFQFSGLAADTAMRLDLAEGDSISSIDISRNDPPNVSSGRYRSIILSGKTERFPFQLTATDPSRVVVASGQTDPFSGSPVPFAFHGANVTRVVEMARPYSVANMTSRSPFPHSSFVSLNKTDVAPWTYRWGVEPARACPKGCEILLADGTEYTDTQGSIHTYLWNIPGEKLDIRDYRTNCFLRQPHVETGYCI